MFKTVLILCLVHLSLARMFHYNEDYQENKIVHNRESAKTPAAYSYSYRRDIFPAISHNPVQLFTPNILYRDNKNSLPVFQILPLPYYHHRFVAIPVIYFPKIQEHQKKVVEVKEVKEENNEPVSEKSLMEMSEKLPISEDEEMQSTTEYQTEEPSTETSTINM